MYLISSFVLGIMQSSLKGSLAQKSGIFFLVSFTSILAPFLLSRILSYSLEKTSDPGLVWLCYDYWIILCSTEPYSQSFQNGICFACSAPSIVTYLTLLPLGSSSLLVNFHYSHICLTKSPDTAYPRFVCLCTCLKNRVRQDSWLYLT